MNSRASGAPEARQAHNLEVGGSIPSCATTSRGPGRVVQAAAFQAVEASSILAARSRTSLTVAKTVFASPIPGGAFSFPRVHVVSAMSPFFGRATAKSEPGDTRQMREADILDIIESTGDVRPIYWLVEKYIQSPEAQKTQAIAQLAELMPMIQMSGYTAGAVRKYIAAKVGETFDEEKRKVEQLSLIFGV